MANKRSTQTTDTTTTLKVAYDPQAEALRLIAEDNEQSVAVFVDTFLKNAPTPLAKRLRALAVRPALSVRTRDSYDGPRHEIKNLDTIAPMSKKIVDAIDSIQGPATYDLIADICDLSVHQVCGAVSVLVSKGFITIEKVVVDESTSRVDNVAKVTDAGRNAKVKESKGGGGTAKSDKPEVPAWTRSLKVEEVVFDWEISEQAEADLNEACPEKKQKATKLSTVWEHLPSRTTDELEALGGSKDEEPEEETD